MKFIVISDMHIHNYKAFDKDGSRLENSLQTIDAAYEELVINDADHILMVGDLYDNQRMLPTIVVNAVVERFKAYTEMYPNVNWYCITGNHDQATKSVYGSEGESALTHLSVMFKQIILIDNDYVNIDGQVLLSGIPYYEHTEHYRTALKAANDRISKYVGAVPQVLMIHQTPSGLANINIPVDTVVEDSYYNFFDMVLCGHIHKKHVLNNKFIVVGSPLHRDLGDAGDEKGVWLMEVDKLNTKKQVKMTFISWRGKFPEYLSVEEGQEYDESMYYGVTAMKAVALREDEKEVAENFSADLAPAALITNFWKQRSTDESLLKIGLSFLPK